MKQAQKAVTRLIGLTLLIACLSAAVQDACADAEARAPDDASRSPGANSGKSFKVWGGHYHYSQGSSGTDLNLRYRGADYIVWAGVYGDGDFGQQARAGAERAFLPIADLPLSLQLSAQVATRGFVGGSITLEYGQPWFFQAGLGRTNNRSYFNLNFDPNDAVSLALGWRGDSGLTVYGLVVRDNRFNKGQQNLHLVARLPMPDRQRLTIDLLRKSGLEAELGNNAWGLSLTWDYRDWSVRLASDRRQNFGEANALRMSLGYRF